MTRTNQPSEKPSTFDELRAALDARFPPGTRGTAAELRAAIAELSCGLGQPEEPGVYKDPSYPGMLWLSWFRPTWPPPPRKDGTYCSPLDKAQITMPGNPETGEGAGTLLHPPSIANQGIKLLGAEEPQNDGYRISLVTRFIASLEGKDKLLDGNRIEAQVWLIRELVTWGRRLRARMAALPQHISSNLTPEEQEESARLNPDFSGGPHRVFPEEADLEYIALLEQIGPKGKSAAAKLRKAPPISQEEADTWAPWLPPSGGGFPARHTRLVVALWEDLVRPRLERAARKPPALARVAYDPVVAILSSEPPLLVTGQTTLDLGLPRPCVIQAEVAAIPRVARGIQLFRSIHAHRVLFHLAFAAHERALAGELDPRVLTYEGGFAALAEACGIEGREGATKARELLEAFAALNLSLPGGDSARGLLTFVYGEARRNRKAYLKIVAGLPLLPDYVQELKRVAGTTSVAARREQDLIPLLPPPPVLGRANDAGAQATQQLRAVALLRDHAPDLAEGRGAPLPLDTWMRLAEESHVPLSLAPKLLSHWQEDHQDGPAVLKRVGRDRYTLGDAHGPARAFLEDGGRRSLDSSEAGRRSAVKCAAARRRVGQK